ARACRARRPHHLSRPGAPDHDARAGAGGGGPAVMGTRAARLLALRLPGGGPRTAPPRAARLAAPERGRRPGRARGPDRRLARGELRGAASGAPRVALARAAA